MQRNENVLIATIAAATIAAGCTLFTGPKSHPVTMSVTSDTIVAVVNAGPASVQFVVSSDRTTSWIQFTVPVTIHNGHSASVTGNPCREALVEPSAADGSKVWAPYCDSANYIDLILA